MPSVRVRLAGVRRVCSAKCVARTSGFELHVAGAEPILAEQVVDCAGLDAESCGRIEGLSRELAPPELYAKGN